MVFALPRKTDSNCPADWLFIAGAELKAIRKLIAERVGFHMCRSKLAEVLEKIFKAELIRLGWFLQKTHDLQKLADELSERKSGLLEGRESLVEALAESYFADRYPGFDFDDPDWERLAQDLRKVSAIMRAVKSSVDKVARS
jgi:HEPN domain-containing protein